MNAARRKALRAAARIGAWDLFLTSGKFIRTKEELIDALDAVFLILREAKVPITEDRLFEIAEAKLGIDRWNFDAIMGELRKTGVFGEEGSP
jgi:hypothetical protein